MTRRAHRRSRAMKMRDGRHRARMGVMGRGSEKPSIRRRRARGCYARRGGACERKLRCKTSSTNPGQSGGGPVLKTESPGAMPTNRSVIENARILTSATVGRLTPSGTITLRSWQHSELGDLSDGSFAGFSPWCLQHSCCTAAVCSPVKNWPSAHRCDNTIQPSSITTKSDLQKAWLERIAFNTHPV